MTVAGNLGSGNLGQGNLGSKEIWKGNLASGLRYCDPSRDTLVTFEDRAGVDVLEDIDAVAV